MCKTTHTEMWMPRGKKEKKSYRHSTLAVHKKKLQRAADFISQK